MILDFCHNFIIANLHIFLSRAGQALYAAYSESIRVQHWCVRTDFAEYESEQGVELLARNLGLVQHRQHQGELII